MKLKRRRTPTLRSDFRFSVSHFIKWGPTITGKAITLQAERQEQEQKGQEQRTKQISTLDLFSLCARCRHQLIKEEKQKFVSSEFKFSVTHLDFGRSCNTKLSVLMSLPCCESRPRPL